MYSYPYPKADNTVDVVLIGKQPRTDYRKAFVLLVQRKKAPYAGCWALPGGFLNIGTETLAQAACRELQEETSIRLSPSGLQQLGTWGNPGRDPRGHVVSTVYYGVVQDIDNYPPTAGDDAAKAVWHPIGNARNLTLAFDHSEIVHAALRRALLL